MPSSLCMGECSERADVGDGRQLFTGRIFYGFRITFFLSLPRFLLSWGKRQTINLVLSWWTKTAQLLSIAYCEESPPPSAISLHCILVLQDFMDVCNKISSRLKKSCAGIYSKYCGKANLKRA